MGNRVGKQEADVNPKNVVYSLGRKASRESAIEIASEKD
jgi:hypothetical protein